MIFVFNPIFESVKSGSIFGIRNQSRIHQVAENGSKLDPDPYRISIFNTHHDLVQDNILFYFIISF